MPSKLQLQDCESLTAFRNEVYAPRMETFFPFYQPFAHFSCRNKISNVSPVAYTEWTSDTAIAGEEASRGFCFAGVWYGNCS